DLENSPFYLVQQTREWSAMPDECGRELPRRAGVSSFGFGGVNAHVVLEEYAGGAPRRQSTARISQENPGLVVLSAKTPERLEDYARLLMAAIEDNGWDDDVLPSLAYTLQVGREAMEERLAFIVSSTEHLREKLAAFLVGKDGIDDLYRGQVKRNKEALAVFSADEELQEALSKWIAKGKLHKLADLWVKGLAFDWGKLYTENPPQRMSLPTYPFARERYWVPLTANNAGNGGASPMLKRNGSRFGDAYYLGLVDRVVDGNLSVDAAVQEMSDV
ncbi:MAG: ketoacyl-synthetase C-terminal extension domain-containing protein, partial [Alphaproteobacteria bacterium]